MSSSTEAEAAIQGLNGMSVGGRSIVVNLARPRESTGGYGAGARGGRSSY
jgi:RNA recognition motif-containing protein